MYVALCLYTCNICVCVYICVCVCIYICIYMYMYIYMNIYMYIYICIYEYEFSASDASDASDASKIYMHAYTQEFQQKMKSEGAEAIQAARNERQKVIKRIAAQNATLKRYVYMCVCVYIYVHM